MAATVQIAETNGPVPGTNTIDIDNLNFGSIDEANLDPAANPITAQADGYSYEKWIRLYVSTLGTSTSVDNVKIWMSDDGGGWKTGERIYVSFSGNTSYTQLSYSEPVNTASAVADDIIQNFEPSEASIGIGGSTSGAITSDNSFTDYAVFQMGVTEQTPAGPVAEKTITFQWDEM